jgi:multidrug transporter EmrE-like cation transporter
MTINPWALLLGAIALEVVSTGLLNASQGMTRRGSRHHCRGFAEGTNLDR